MGISRDTFDQLKHYVSVRLQQGVPLVDADWNEREDIRRYDLQAFLKWFVGDGVPLGDQGFAIMMRPGVDNDFLIHAGRCLVEGRDVINEGLVEAGVVVNENFIAYSEQVLTDQDIADALGVDPVPPLITPTVDGDYTAYLDIWEREVLPGEIGDDPYVYDRDLINEDIGLPTCTRSKREWVVRLVEGVTLPTLAPDSGHVLYPLARIARRNGEARIYAVDITDLRRTGLKVGSYYDTQQIVRDAFGDSYTLDGDGEPDLKVSLRETINALLRGAVPMTAPAQFSLEAAYERNSNAVVDSLGDTWVFWQSYRSGNGDIWCRRYDRASGTWGADTQITADTASDDRPRAVVGADGALWVFWLSYRSGNYDIWCNHRPAVGDWATAEQVSTGTESDSNHVVVVDGAGQIWVFWESYRGGNANIYYNRRPAGGWVGQTALTSDTGADNQASVLIDAQGRPMVFWRAYRDTNYDLYFKSYDPVDGWGPDTRLTSDTGGDYAPFAVMDTEGTAWVFWYNSRSGNSDIWCRQGRLVDSYGELYWQWSPDTQLTSDAAYDSSPVAVAGAQGDVWVFWQSGRSGSNTEVWYKRYSRDGGWSRDRPLGADYGASVYSDYVYEISATLDGDGDIRVFWSLEYEGGGYSYNLEIWHAKFIPQI